MLTQRTFLAGQVLSIDNSRIIKTVSTNYEELEVIFFEHTTIKPDDVIIDVGCGKGRVFSYLLYKGLRNRMIGYEINEAVGLKTKKRLARYKNVEIRCGNIFDAFPPEGNIFYMYHPFHAPMVTDFMNQILSIADRNPVILYNNPIHLDVFDNDKFSCQVFDVPVSRYNYSFRFAIIRLV